MPTTSEQLLSDAACAFNIGKYQDSIDLSLHVLETDAKATKAVFLISVSNFKLGNISDATEWMLKYTHARPQDADGWFNLGVYSLHQQDIKQTLEYLQKAIKLNEKHQQAWAAIASVFSRTEHLDKALGAFAQALKLEPTDLLTLLNYASTLKNMGFVSDAISIYERALESHPTSPEALSGVCYCSQYLSGCSLSGLKQIHARYDERHIQPQAWGVFEHATIRKPRTVADTDATDKNCLRVGFLSDEFREPTIGGWLISVFESLDADKYCYVPVTVEDAVTSRFKQAATKFTTLPTDPMDAAKLIYTDDLDVLIDVSGHTRGQVLKVLAYKPARKQCTWLYPGTTGISTVDGIITTADIIPVSYEPEYNERILRFPSTYANVCYTPPKELINNTRTVTDSIVFGTVANASKFQSQTLQTWAKILHASAGSKLLFKGQLFGSADAYKWVVDVFNKMGISADRLIFKGYSPYAERFSIYNDMDVYLDTFPVSGCASTCEALYMGVPVITLPQATAASRQSLAFLRLLGAYDFIATSPDQYVEMAVRLAQTPARLGYLRSNLRNKFLASNICNAQGMAEELKLLLTIACKEN